MYSISTCGYKLWLLRCKQNEFEYFEKKQSLFKIIHSSLLCVITKEFKTLIQC